MMRLLLCFVLLPYLLFSKTTTALYQLEEVCSSSCGKLQNIHPPFRVKDDPEYCGDPSYELSCDRNDTILNLPFGKYYVTNISFNPNQLQVVDVGLASGNCLLPLGSISPQKLKNGTIFESTSPVWTSFVNCTNAVKRATYRSVPCLSHNKSYVFVVSGYEVKEMEISCGFLAMVPSIRLINTSSNIDVFQLLQRGFTLSWRDKPKTFGYCFASYLRVTRKVIYAGNIYWMMINIPFLEFGFIKCVSKSKDVSGLPLAIAFVILLDITLFILVTRVVFAPLIIYAFLSYQYIKMLIPVDAIGKFLQSHLPLISPTRYAYSDITSITSHFKEKLGQGGFGSVYKGRLPGGQLVAVKMLSNTTSNGDDFINEVATIGRIYHKNVVELLGFCSEGSKRALVYEYMPNGSLDKYIFSSSSPINHNSSHQRAFTWDKLSEIALGVAKGIDYLHQGCEMRILHFDIKPHNILLDETFNPKVADFGLAKLYPKDYSAVSISATRGTIGYIAPELISRNFGVISHKSDVYSYGMLLLEIAGGRRNVNLNADDTSQVYYPSWIYNLLNQREGPDINHVSEIVEAYTEQVSEIGDEERKLCKVGLWCIQMQPINRPSMSKVVEMLEANVDTLPMPPKPFFSSPEQTPDHQLSFDSSFSALSSTSEYE